MTGDSTGYSASASAPRPGSTLRGRVARLRYEGLIHVDEQSKCHADEAHRISTTPVSPNTQITNDPDVVDRFAAGAPATPTVLPDAARLCLTTPPWLDRRYQISWRRSLAHTAAWLITIAITLATTLGMMGAVLGWEQSAKIASAAQAAVHAILSTASDLARR